MRRLFQATSVCALALGLGSLAACGGHEAGKNGQQASGTQPGSNVDPDLGNDPNAGSPEQPAADAGSQGGGDVGVPPGDAGGSRDAGGPPPADSGGGGGPGKCAAAPRGWRPIASELTVGSGKAYFLDGWAGGSGEITTNNASTPAWTGKEMFVLGVTGDPTTLPLTMAEAAAYDPSSNTWRRLPDPPHFREDSFWTGDAWLVFGQAVQSPGAFDASTLDGYLYDPKTNLWTPIPVAPLSPRSRPAAVWSTTTHELIVWGGDHGFGGGDPADGAAYDPVKKTWRMIAASPLSGRSNMGAAWDGTKMIIIGGGQYQCSTPSCDTFMMKAKADGAAYDPKTDSWSVLTTRGLPPSPRVSPVAVGEPGHAYFFGGYSKLDDPFLPASYVDGAWYDETPDGFWEHIMADPDLAWSPRAGGHDRSAYAFAAGDPSGDGRFWLYGGTGQDDADKPTTFSDGAMWDDHAGSWFPLEAAGNPGPRVNALGMWTGCDFLVFGGYDDKSNRMYDGAMYRF